MIVAPNVVSIAVIVGLIALAQGLSDTLPSLGEPWVPFAVVVLGALVKALQVVLTDLKRQQRGLAETSSRLRRWLVE